MNKKKKIFKKNIHGRHVEYIRMTTLVCITPIYNAGRLVVDTIVSIKTQTVFFTTNDEPIEILHVIVDGNSTDDPLALAKKCYGDIASYDNLSVLYVSEDDKGMYDAVTKGFALADKHVDGDIFCYQAEGLVLGVINAVIGLRYPTYNRGCILFN